MQHPEQPGTLCLTKEINPSLVSVTFQNTTLKHFSDGGDKELSGSGKGDVTVQIAPFQVYIWAPFWYKNYGTNLNIYTIATQKE